jgi:hypothetical protein
LDDVLERLVMGRVWSATERQKKESDFGTNIFQHSYMLILHCVLHVQFTTHTHIT